MNYVFVPPSTDAYNGASVKGKPAGTSSFPTLTSAAATRWRKSSSASPTSSKA